MACFSAAAQPGACVARTRPSNCPNCVATASAWSDLIETEAFIRSIKAFVFAALYLSHVSIIADGQLESALLAAPVEALAGVSVGTGPLLPSPHALVTLIIIAAVNQISAMYGLMRNRHFLCKPIMNRE